jgi:hypothetical protein
MGRRQASAPARAAAFLPARVRPVHRGVCRQWCGVLRLARNRSAARAERPLIDSNADLIGCYETVRDAPGAVTTKLARLARAHAVGARALPGGARRALQSAPRQTAAARRPHRVHARSGGHADLAESYGLQRAVSCQRERRVQRATRTIRTAGDRRSREAGARGGCARSAGREAAVRLLRVDAHTRAGRRLLVFDPPYAPNEPHVELHGLHRVAVWARRAAPLAGGRHRGWPSAAVTC